MSSTTAVSRRAALARILPFALYIAFLVIAAPLAERTGMDVRWMYAVQIACVIAALMYFWPDYAELREPPPDTPLRGAAGWMAALSLGVAVWALWIWLDFSPFAFAPGPGYQPLDEAGALIPLMLSLIHI